MRETARLALAASQTPSEIVTPVRVSHGGFEKLSMIYVTGDNVHWDLHTIHELLLR